MNKRIAAFSVGWMIGGALVFGVAAPMMAEGATITVGDAPTGGVAYGMDVNDFTRLSDRCGSGSSVVNDGCSVVKKNDPAAPHAYGRYDPFGGSWIDSQDIETLRWDISTDVAFTSVSFAMTDMVDQADTHLTVTTSEGGYWEAPGRIANGGVYWFTVVLDAPLDALAIVFNTRHNDGYGISAASTSPVPLPAGLLLVLAGAGALVIASFWPRA